MAKKRASGKKQTLDEDGNPRRDEYFIRGGKAYVRVQSGDVFGPYDKGTAAYKTAIKDSMTGRTVEFGTRSTLEGMKSFMRGGGLRRGSM